MSTFTEPLVITQNKKHTRWVIMNMSFGYEVGCEDSGYTVKVPQGFETDFASIPWFARWLVKTWGRHTNAAVIHDFLYRGGQVEKNEMAIWASEIPVAEVMPRVTRRGADRIMLEAMKVLEVKRWRQLVIYYGLRIGSNFVWNRMRREEQ